MTLDITCMETPRKEDMVPDNIRVPGDWEQMDFLKLQFVNIKIFLTSGNNRHFFLLRKLLQINNFNENNCFFFGTKTLCSSSPFEWKCLLLYIMFTLYKHIHIRYNVYLFIYFCQIKIKAGGLNEWLLSVKYYYYYIVFKNLSIPCI